MALHAGTPDDGTLAPSVLHGTLWLMSSAGADAPPPPRVLVVMPDQWPRALLRASLREIGYDALGAADLAAALQYPAHVSERGPVQLVLVDQKALGDAELDARLDALLRRHDHPTAVLLARPASAHPRPAATDAARWARILQRPASIADLVGTVQALLPLSPASARPLD